MPATTARISTSETGFTLPEGITAPSDSKRARARQAPCGSPRRAAGNPQLLERSEEPVGAQAGPAEEAAAQPAVRERQPDDHRLALDVAVRDVLDLLAHAEAVPAVRARVAVVAHDEDVPLRDEERALVGVVGDVRLAQHGVPVPVQVLLVELRVLLEPAARSTVLAVPDGRVLRDEVPGLGDAVDVDGLVLDLHAVPGHADDAPHEV